MPKKQQQPSLLALWDSLDETKAEETSQVKYRLDIQTEVVDSHPCVLKPDISLMLQNDGRYDG